MHTVALSFIAAAVAGGRLAVAQQSTFPATPLASKHFSYPTGVPYQADTDTNLIRGGQFGYNQCNSTTEGQTSLCQTSFASSLDDFCLWAPSEPNSLIADTEGEEVAWCTKGGRGTRLIPEGALTGVQMLKTPDYIQFVGFIDQTKINIADGDFGGELDPHGADLRGNPLGGLMYSTAWSSDNNTYQQVIEWTNFMGGNAFCLKVCDPAGANAANYCQHIYDRIGCSYNAPNAAQDKVFEMCDSDNADFPGVYTDASGAVQTYTQPPESLGAITSMPYTARVASSSNCVTFQSSELFAALATVSGSGSSATATGSASGSVTGSGSSAHPTGASTSRASGSATASGANPSASGNDATALTVGAVSFFGVVFSALFLS